jgi:hypothetical protein
LAQRAFCAAAIRARPSGEIVRFFLRDPAGRPAPRSAAPALALLILAHRAFCAAAIRARPSGEIVRFLLADPAGRPGPR